MNKEQQDKLWNELSEEYKDYIRERYLKLRDTAATADCMLTELFGSHNLNPKPLTPKTWEDMMELHGDYYYIGGNTSGVSDALKKKAIATLKIARLIELSYGGMVSEEEWKDDSMEKFKITPFKNGGFQVVRYYSIQHKDILSFRDRKTAEEFISHESNRSLVRDYYLMEKGESV